MTTDSRPAIVRFVERLDTQQTRLASCPEPTWPEEPARDGVAGGTHPRALTAEFVARLDRAARRALAHYPGPVGALIGREIRAFVEFGHRFGPDALVMRLADELLSDDPAPSDQEVAPWHRT